MPNIEDPLRKWARETREKIKSMSTSDLIAELMLQSGKMMKEKVHTMPMVDQLMWLEAEVRQRFKDLDEKLEIAKMLIFQNCEFPTSVSIHSDSQAYMDFIDERIQTVLDEKKQAIKENRLMSPDVMNLKIDTEQAVVEKDISMEPI